LGTPYGPPETQQKYEFKTSVTLILQNDQCKSTIMITSWGNDINAHNKSWLSSAETRQFNLAQ
jgi:hypothetical protein